MANELTDLYEKRVNIWEQMKEIMDIADGEGRAMSAEEVQKYDRAETELEKVSATIERKEKHEARLKKEATFDSSDLDEREDKSGRVDPLQSNEEYREVFMSFVRDGIEGMDHEQKKLLRSGWRGEKEGRAAAAGTGSAGGYLIPQGFRQTIIERQKAYGAVDAVATVINTNTGAVLPWATNDDTGNIGALLAENVQVAEQDVTLGTEQLGAYKYTSKLIRVSLEFLQDLDWTDAESFLARKFAQRLGRIRNQHLTTGTGSSQPQGIVTGSTSGVTAASATAIAYDELIDLEFSIDIAYRDYDISQYMLGDGAMKLIRKLKDGQSRYLWQPNPIAGQPATLNGYKYVINNDMPAVATGNKTVLFGDFEAGYVVRNVKDFQLIRLNERYADYFQVGFVAFERTDGLVQDSYAYRALTQA